MKIVNVGLKENSYKIFCGTKLELLGKELKKLGFSGNVLVATNPKVKALYFSQLAKGLKSSGFDVTAAIIPDGEKFKTLNTIEKLYNDAVKLKVNRKTVVVALGGGVTGDMAGFFAATFMRGLPFVQVPTTLLAMVDSSVGGKTGVDLPAGKNLVGAFYQPKLVWIDLSTLNTLPEKEIRNGMAEVIKYGVIKDAKFFNFLENNISLLVTGSGSRVTDMVAHCCAIKADVVKNDEKETKGLREILNFGHTFGHAIETLTGYKKYSHGEAVAIGMNMAGNLAVEMRLFSEKERQRVENLLVYAGLPVRIKEFLDTDKMLSAMSKDKKVINGALRLVLPVKIGKVFVHKGVNPKTVADIL